MIHKEKNGYYAVVCSICKNEVKSPLMASEDDALEQAKYQAWFIMGKFHFCPLCFDNALDQWKADNYKLLENNEKEK